MRNLSQTVWTISSIKEYFERRFEDLEKLTNVERKLHQLALDVAKSESDRRLEGMNEFREENRRNMSVTITRDKFDAEVGNIRKDLNDLMNWKASVLGTQSRSNLISIISIVIVVIIAVADVFLHYNH